MADPIAKPEPRKKRRWLRRIFRTLLALVLLVLIFHRPIVHYGGRWAAIHFAKREHMTVDLEIRGNLWSRFEIHNVSVKASGTGPAPIESLSLDRLTVDYDVWQLIRGNPAGLRAVELGKLDTVITPPPPKPKRPDEPKKPRKSAAEQLRLALARPLPQPRVKIGEVNVRVREKKGEIVIRGVHADMEAAKPGSLGWSRIEIPNVPPIETASAAIEVGPDRFELRDLTIWPEIVLASARVQRPVAEKPAEIGLDVKLAGGALTARIHPVPASPDFQAQVRAETQALATIAARFGGRLPMVVDNVLAEAEWCGDPEKREASTGHASFSLRGKKDTALPGWSVEGKASLQAGKLDLPSIEVRSAESAATLQGAFDLGPLLAHRGEGRPPIPQGAIDFRLNAPDLAKAAAEFNQEARGSAQASGKLTLAEEALNLTAAIEGKDLGRAELVIGNVRGQFAVRAPLREPLPALLADVSLEVDRLQAGAAQVDRIRVTGKFDHLQATLSEALVIRGSNQFRASGRAKLLPDGKFAEPPNLDFTIEAPGLAEFGIVVKDAPLTGAIRGAGKLSLVGGEPTGAINVTGSALQIGSAKAGEFTVDLTAAEGRAEVKLLQVRFNETDRLELRARGTLKEPNAYDGELSLNVKDLAAFQPILDVLRIPQKIGGAVSIEWKGQGDRAQHRGDGRIAAQKLRVDTLEIDDFKLTSVYTPEQVEVPELSLVAAQLRGKGQIKWAGKRLDVSGLELLLGGKPALTGSISAPLDPAGKSILPGDLPISTKLEAKNLDLARVFRELKLKPPVEGVLSTSLEASGTLEKPLVKLAVEGRGMRLPAANGTKPEGAKGGTDPRQRAMMADFDTGILYENNRVALTTTVRHAELQPLTLKAELPLELKPLLEGKTPDWKTIPIKASASLPNSSLAVVTKFAPAVSRIEGLVALTAQVNGPLGNPDVTALLASETKLIRLAGGTAPPISDLGVRIRVANRIVTIEKLSGQTGGGTFDLRGTINAQNPQQIALDLAAKANKVLALRNDEMIVRVDADVAVRGPLNAGTVSGRVTLAQSRFSKELEIIPLLLPERSKPTPRAVSQPKVISFPDPPLRDWKFDLAIQTTADDPFLVRGNLAKGSVAVDLRLQGTGLEPYLVGSASIEQFSAQLPVSRLTTRRGLVMFSREAPFEPRIELETQTVIRGYTIVARIDGVATAPRLDLSSEPPLPQREIMSLLATGSMSGEIGENNTALATRAGLIVLQEWYRKLFKRELPVPSDDGGDNFMDRFNVDIGSVDARTGRQEVTAEFRVTDRVKLIGEADLGAGVTGRIQYLFRFR